MVVMAQEGEVMETTVVNIRHQQYDEYIGRGSPLGNPFIIGRDGTREEVIEKYKNYIITHPELLKLIRTLKGKRLGCFCAPLPCHGDVVKALADQVNDANEIDESHFASWWWDYSQQAQEIS